MSPFNAQRLLLLAVAVLPSPVWAVAINELRIAGDQETTERFVELYGNPGESLAGLALIQLGVGAHDDGVSDPGLILEYNPMDGVSLDAQGFAIYGFAEELNAELPYLCGGNAPAAYLIVRGLQAVPGVELSIDLDSDNDGVFDGAFTEVSIVDGIYLASGGADPFFAYGAPQTLLLPEVGFGNFRHAFRSPDGTGDFVYNDSLSGELDTPRALNVSALAVPEPSMAWLAAGVVAGVLNRRRR